MNKRLSLIFLIFNLCIALFSGLFTCKNINTNNVNNSFTNHSLALKRNKDEVVSKYINQRTFSLISYENENANYKTQHISNCWLFYHENKYTYYALSNLNNMLTSSIEYIAYQSIDEILNNEDLKIDDKKTNVITSNNYFSVNEKQVSKTFCQKWNEFFLDLIIIKLDFSNFYEQEQVNKYGQFELRNRLDDLNNEYSDNSFLVDFDFSQNNSSLYDNYICGFTENNRLSKFSCFIDKTMDKYYVDYNSYAQYSYRIWSQNVVWNSGFASCKKYDSSLNGLEGSMHVYAYVNNKNEVVIRTNSLFSRWIIDTNRKYQLQTQSFVLNWENKNNFINDFFNNYDKNNNWLQEDKFNYESPFSNHINTVEWMIIILISTLGTMFAFAFLWLLIHKYKK